MNNLSSEYRKSIVDSPAYLKIKILWKIIGIIFLEF